MAPRFIPYVEFRCISYVAFPPIPLSVFPIYSLGGIPDLTPIWHSCIISHMVFRIYSVYAIPVLPAQWWARWVGGWGERGIP